MVELAVSKNSGTPKSSILIGFSTINHPFWGTPIFGNTQMVELLRRCGGPPRIHIYIHICDDHSFPKHLIEAYPKIGISIISCEFSNKSLANECFGQGRSRKDPKWVWNKQKKCIGSTFRL